LVLVVVKIQTEVILYIHQLRQPVEDMAVKITLALVVQDPETLVVLVAALLKMQTLVLLAVQERQGKVTTVVVQTRLAVLAAAAGVVQLLLVSMVITLVHLNTLVMAALDQTLFLLGQQQQVLAHLDTMQAVVVLV
jgi:hypothetical protein